MTIDERVERLRGAAETSGIFCDFDGTLSAIVADPEDARPVRGAQAALVRLARRYAVVAIVSGRSVASLTERLRVPGVILVGLHGIEQRRGRRTTVHHGAEASRDAVSRAYAALREQATGGVEVEHKGLALAVHFRNAPDPAHASKAFAPVVAGVAGAEDLAVRPGRRIVELVPRGASDKGAAVARLVAEFGLRGAFFAGDDAGDIPAFEAIAGLDPRCRVAVASAESPPGLAAAADHTVAGPSEVVALMRSLAG